MRVQMSPLLIQKKAPDTVKEINVKIIGKQIKIKYLKSLNELFFKLNLIK